MTLTREHAAAHEAGHAVAAWHYKLYLGEVRIGDLPAPDGTVAGGWVRFSVPPGRTRAVGAILLAGYAGAVMAGTDDDLAWDCAQGDYADLGHAGARTSWEAVQGYYGDACRILSRRWKQWERLHARLLETDVLEWREIATIVSRRDPYA